MSFEEKEPIQVKIFRVSTARMKINQIPYVIFPEVNFLLNFASPFSVMADNSYEIF